VSLEIDDIDHLMLSVRDSKKAGEIFAGMGFAITPRGQLPGMSNHLVCFSDGKTQSPNFIELMSLDVPEEAPPAMAAALRIPDRPVLMVAATRDAEATRAGLNRAGLEVSPVLESGRTWELPDGEIIEFSFSIVLPEGGQAPFYWIACQHKTPHHYLRPEFVSHENRSLALTRIIAVANNPASAAEHFSGFWDMPVKEREEGQPSAIVSGERVALHIHSDASFREAFAGVAPVRSEDHIAGFAVSVDNLEALEIHLRANNFSPHRTKEGLVLEPDEACGCLVVFEAA